MAMFFLPLFRFLVQMHGLALTVRIELLTTLDAEL